MTGAALQREIERLAAEPEPSRERAAPAVEALLGELETGAVRAAEPRGDDWEVQAWVKRGILLGFRIGVNVESSVPPAFYFRDRDTLPTLPPPRDVRVVPGGTTVRRGCHLGSGTVIMPPAYVNVGAWVGEGTMIDSHALVGSCAQLGRRVHLSAAAQLGGVLEPPGAMPVIVEDEVFVGGGCGIYEGTRVGRAAVLAAGVVLTRSVRVYDLVHERVVQAQAGRPLAIPAGAVVVPGARPAGGAFAASLGVHLHTPVIVKYRDPSTSAALVLEEALR